MVGLLATTVVAAGGLRLATAQGDDRCEGPARLAVTASPDIAPVLRDVAARLVQAGDGCAQVEVTAASSVEVITGLARGDIRPPDVWVPDSSLWLQRADVDALASVTQAPSVAASPLVLALTRGAAGRLAASGAPTIGDVLAGANADRLTVELSAERLSPARVGAVLALSAATTGLPSARAALAATLRSVRATPGETTVATVQSQTPDDPPLITPLPEQAVWHANTRTAPAAGARPLVAVYPGSVTYDYPYAVLTERAGRAQLADQLFGLLRGSTAQALLATAGFRGPDGAANPRLRGHGVDGTRVVPPEPLGEGSVALAERTLAGVSEDARLLTVLDVSGSMAWPVAGPAGTGPTRARIARGAAAQGLALYPDSTEVGLWVFPGASGPYDEVAPVTTLGPVRSSLAEALAGVRAGKRGGTPLYAATLAAVRAQQRAWQPGKVNAVIVLSDGRDTRSAVDLPAVLDRLRQVADSARPVPVITVAFGPQSDREALDAISRASDGASYHADTGADIRRIFLDALGRRGCRPDCSAPLPASTQESAP